MGDSLLVLAKSIYQMLVTVYTLTDLKSLPDTSSQIFHWKQFARHSFSLFGGIKDSLHKLSKTRESTAGLINVLSASLASILTSCCSSINNKVHMQYLVWEQLSLMLAIQKVTTSTEPSVYFPEKLIIYGKGLHKSYLLVQS